MTRAVTEPGALQDLHERKAPGHAGGPMRLPDEPADGRSREPPLARSRALRRLRPLGHRQRPNVRRPHVQGRRAPTELPASRLLQVDGFDIEAIGPLEARTARSDNRFLHRQRRLLHGEAEEHRSGLLRSASRHVDDRSPIGDVQMTVDGVRTHGGRVRQLVVLRQPSRAGPSDQFRRRRRSAPRERTGSAHLSESSQPGNGIRSELPWELVQVRLTVSGWVVQPITNPNRGASR